MRSLPAFLAVALFAVACEDNTLTQLEPDLEISPEQLDFGSSDLGQPVSEILLLESRAAIPSLIEAVRIEDDCGGCFLAIEPPERVETFRTADLEIRFRPRAVGVATGTVTVVSDDPDEPELVAFLIGRGTDNRKPDIEVLPAQVNFGFVPAGGVAVSSFVIRSTGTNTLQIDRIRIEPPDAPFRITTSTPTPERPGSLEPDEQASVGLRAELPVGATATVAAQIFIETNVVDEKNVPGSPGVVSVPISAQANFPPIAVVSDDQIVEPWSRVFVDGSESFDVDDPPNEPLQYFWRLVSQPEGSTTQMERARQPLASFWADLTGVYEAELTVVDALGLESEPEVVVIEARPSNAIRIELTWDHPDSDVDLHLIREGSTFCDCGGDVHFRDCGQAPNWFPEAPGANPRLDIDDRSGFGPENINIDGDGAERFIPDGVYTIAVHYYSTNEEFSSWPTSDSTVTVRVFIFGQLAAELTRQLTLTNELWYAGVINVPELTVEPRDRVDQDIRCGMF